jgi:hypothetical protein
MNFSKTTRKFRKNKIEFENFDRSHSVLLVFYYRLDALGCVPERIRAGNFEKKNPIFSLKMTTSTLDLFSRHFFRIFFFERKFQKKKKRGQKISFHKCSSPSVYEPFEYVSDRIRTILKFFFGSAPKLEFCAISRHFSDPEPRAPGNLSLANGARLLRVVSLILRFS